LVACRLPRQRRLKLARLEAATRVPDLNRKEGRGEWKNQHYKPVTDKGIKQGGISTKERCRTFKKNNSQELI